MSALFTIYGTAVMTLTSKARGCKLLHKHRCAVQTWSLHQKKRKRTKEKKSGAVGERLETLNGTELTTAPMSAEQDGVPCNQHGADIMGLRGRHGRCDTEMELIAKAAVGARPHTPEYSVNAFCDYARVGCTTCVFCFAVLRERFLYRPWRTMRPVRGTCVPSSYSQYAIYSDGRSFFLFFTIHGAQSVPSMACA